MRDIALNTATSAAPKQGAYWPRAIAWLAVVAYISVALALWQAPKPKYDLPDPQRAIVSALLLAQTNLLTVWLIVGSAPWVRRFAWTLCGWSAISWLASTAERLQGTTLFGLAVQAPVTAMVLILLRWRDLTVTRVSRTHASCIDSRHKRQFSILELFAATLGVALAAAMLIRSNLAATSFLHNYSDTMTIVFVVSLPAAMLTLIAVNGLRRDSGVGPQLFLSGMALILAIAFCTDPHWTYDGLFHIHSAHWFLVAATLWIFQMCGYRLVRPSD